MEEKWGPNTSFYLWSSLIFISFYFLKALVACSCHEIAGFPCIRVPVKSNCKANLCRRIKTICENCFKWHIVLIHLFIKELWCLLSVKSCGKHGTWGRCETRSHPGPPRNLNISGGGNTQTRKYTSMQLNYKLSKSHTKKTLRKRQTGYHARELWLVGKGWGKQLWVARDGLPETSSETEGWKGAKCIITDQKWKQFSC